METTTRNDIAGSLAEIETALDLTLYRAEEGSLEETTLGLRNIREALVSLRANVEVQP